MSIFSKKLGIDLGTANILVFVPGRGVVLNEPSVVAVSEEDNRILAIGIEAKEMMMKAWIGNDRTDLNEFQLVDIREKLDSRYEEKMNIND